MFSICDLYPPGNGIMIFDISIWHTRLLRSADGLGIAVRKQRETLGREKLPLSTWRPAARVTSTAEAISSKLRKCVKDIMLLIEQSSFYKGDLIQFRLDWLYSVVVRYVDYRSVVRNSFEPSSSSCSSVGHR